MAHIRPPYFISAQLIAELMDVDIRYASDRLTAIRKTLNKPFGAHISLAEYCAYEHTSQKELEAYFMRTRGNYIPPEENKKADKVR